MCLHTSVYQCLSTLISLCLHSSIYVYTHQYVFTFIKLCLHSSVCVYTHQCISVCQHSSICDYTPQYVSTTLIRAATFTRVNGTVLCFCNNLLQNWLTVYTNFSMWQTLWFINSISLMKKYSLKQWYVTFSFGSSNQIVCFLRFCCIWWSIYHN